MKKSNAINARDSLFATRKMITAGEGENHGGVFDRVYPCFVKMISMRCDNSIEDDVIDNINRRLWKISRIS